MKKYRPLIALIIAYMFYAVLLNSVGTVISQSILSFGITKPEGSILEGFKDISIAIVSFVVASFLPRLGYQKAIIISLIMVSLACFIMPIAPSFNSAKILFFIIGVSFAMIKVSVYSSIGLINEDPKSHASFTSIIEGFFMVGVLGGAWIFAAFVDVKNPNSLSWLNVYYYLGGFGLLAALLWLFTPLPKIEASAIKSDWREDFKAIPALFASNFLISFLLGIFLYVLIEQSIGTWLPTYNREILQLNPAMAIQAGSLFAAFSAIGRLLGGVFLRYFDWVKVLIFCAIATALIIIIAMQMSGGDIGKINSWRDAPLKAFFLPLAGLFLGPIYPTINSIVLSSLPKQSQAPMTGLIIAFSALGGTLGSFITGQIFGHFGGAFAFYLTLIPVALMSYSFIILNKKLRA